MIISAVIPTYRREDLLANAVGSVLSQDVRGADVEVKVVNDSGEPLQHADWQDDPRVQVLTTYRSERCVARNTGAAVSRGDYLHFLDDDDVILPGGYSALLEAAETSSADFVSGAYELVDDDGAHIDNVYPPWKGNAFAISITGPYPFFQATLVRKDAFLKAGGFDLSYKMHEDGELFQRITLNGESESIEDVVARIRYGLVSAQSLTPWELRQEFARVARDKVFGHPECLRRVLGSLREIQDREYRRKVVRYYFGSAVYNIRRGAVLNSVSRCAAGCRVWFAGLAVRDHYPIM